MLFLCCSTLHCACLVKLLIQSFKPSVRLRVREWHTLPRNSRWKGFVQLSKNALVFPWSGGNTSPPKIRLHGAALPVWDSSHNSADGLLLWWPTSHTLARGDNETLTSSTACRANPASSHQLTPRMTLRSARSVHALRARPERRPHTALPLFPSRSTELSCASPAAWPNSFSMRL